MISRLSYFINLLESRFEIIFFKTQFKHTEENITECGRIKIRKSAATVI